MPSSGSSPRWLAISWGGALAIAAVAGTVSASLAVASTGVRADPALVGRVACSSAMIVYPPAAPGPTDRVLFGQLFVDGRDDVPSPNSQPSGTRPFVFFSKAGIAIRRGSRAVVELPARWRSRVAVQWGDSGIVSRVDFPACHTGPKWIAYAGGFHFRSMKGGCVPLRITVASRTMTLLFSSGKRC